MRISTPLKGQRRVFDASNRFPSPVVGPYRVLPNDRRTITIDRDGVTEPVSADRCVYAPPPANEQRASTTTPGDVSDKITEGTQHSVERLLKHRVMEDGTTQLPLKWVDYDTHT